MKLDRKFLHVLFGFLLGIAVSIWVFFPYDLTAATDNATILRFLVILIIMLGALVGYVVSLAEDL